MKYALTDTIAEILGHPVPERSVNALVRCPFHDDRHASLSIHLENGFWICFACGERGGLSSLSARLGKEFNDAELALKVYEGSKDAIYEDPKDFTPLAAELRATLHKARPNTVVKFLTERNLSPRVLKHFGIGWDGHRIAFPYYDDGKVIGIKYRDGSGAKSAEYGTKRGIYNVNDVRFKPYVILCEGESDTLAVWSALTETYSDDIVASIGVGGVPGVAGSTATWDVWALDLLWAEKVYVAYDDDAAGDSGAELPLTAVGDRGVRIRPILGKDMNEHFINGGQLSDFTELAGPLGLAGRPTA